MLGGGGGVAIVPLAGEGASQDLHVRTQLGQLANVDGVIHMLEFKNGQPKSRALQKIQQVSPVIQTVQVCAKRDNIIVTNVLEHNQRNNNGTHPNGAQRDSAIVPTAP